MSAGPHFREYERCMLDGPGKNCAHGTDLPLQTVYWSLPKRSPPKATYVFTTEAASSTAAHTTRRAGPDTHMGLAQEATAYQ